MSHAKIISVHIHAPHLMKMSEADKQKLRDDSLARRAAGLPELPPPENTSLLTKIARAKQEIIAWNASGRPRASKQIRQARLAACRTCEYYNAKGNFLLGECRAPGCGCTRVKLFLLTAKCPHPAGSRWPITHKP